MQMFLRKLPHSTANTEHKKQVIRSASAIGANYIEANDALGKNDFVMRIKISRKEAKETYYWLQLLELENDQDLIEQRDKLMQEAHELRLILSTIVQKMLKKQFSKKVPKPQDTTKFSAWCLHFPCLLYLEILGNQLY